MKKKYNFVVLLLAVMIVFSVEAVHTQEQVDPWLQAFVKSLKKDDAVKTNGVKVGALRGASSPQNLYVAMVIAPLPALALAATNLSLRRWNVRQMNGAEYMAFVSGVTVSFALIGSGMWLLGQETSFKPQGKKPYIIFDEKGLVIDNKRVLEWSNIEVIEVGPSSVCYTDQFGNDITITPAQLAVLPMTAKNIIALAKHYIAKAKTAGDQKISASPANKPVPAKPVVQQAPKVESENNFMEDDDEESF